MVRSGDQEQPSPGGTCPSKESPQVPAARTARLPARWRGASAADSQSSDGEARLADVGDARRVPRQRQVPTRRASLLWLMPSLRAPALRPRPSPPGLPGPAEQDQGADHPHGTAEPVGQAEQGGPVDQGGLAAGEIGRASCRERV